MRLRMEGSQSKNHEDRIAGRGMNSLSRYSPVHKFIPMPQAMKIPVAKAAVEKMGKVRENTDMAAVKNCDSVGFVYLRHLSCVCCFC